MSNVADPKTIPNRVKKQARNHIDAAYEGDLAKLTKRIDETTGGDVLNVLSEFDLLPDTDTPITLSSQLTAGETYIVEVDGVDYEVICEREYGSNYPTLSFKPDGHKHYMNIQWINRSYQQASGSGPCHVAVKAKGVRTIPSRFIPCTIFYSKTLPKFLEAGTVNPPELLYKDKEYTITVTRDEFIEAYKHGQILIYSFILENIMGAGNGLCIPQTISDNVFDISIQYTNQTGMYITSYTDERRGDVEATPVK